MSFDLTGTSALARLDICKERKISTSGSSGKQMGLCFNFSIDSVLCQDVAISYRLFFLYFNVGQWDDKYF